MGFLGSQVDIHVHEREVLHHLGEVRGVRAPQISATFIHRCSLAQCFSYQNRQPGEAKEKHGNRCKEPGVCLVAKARLEALGLLEAGVPFFRLLKFPFRATYFPFSRVAAPSGYAASRRLPCLKAVDKVVPELDRRFGLLVHLGQPMLGNMIPILSRK